MTNPLARLPEFGQSVWLDFVSRSLLEKGDLKRLIEEDGLRGVTSNPSIFEKAIGHSGEYDDELIAFETAGDHSVSELFEHLAIADIQAAADQLRPVYERTNGVDGYISLEVSPYLAMATDATIAEARRLWRAVDRPNLMVKVPGTTAGAPAIRVLIEEGLNINVTLLFSIAAYDAVAQAYIGGLEARVAKGEDISRIASVASFFVSRIDTAVDKIVAEKLPTASPEVAAKLRGLSGKVAIANGKLAYQHYKKLIAEPRWQTLAAKGAMPQRLLWASTGTKSKELPDTLYVDQLIGPETVNTMPPATMQAVRDHGTPANTVEADLDAARAVLHTLKELGISLDAITDDLVIKGVEQFAGDADKLYGAVAARRRTVLDGKDPLQRIAFADSDLSQAMATETERWRSSGLIRQLWAKDKALWTGDDEDKWLGWLTIVDEEIDDLAKLEAFAQEVVKARFSDVVLLGMGGSSLGPEVLAETFGHRAGWPRFHMLDSTDPAQVRAIEHAISLKTSLFIVSSKSGSTLEPNIFQQYFYARLQDAGVDAGAHFVAVTDPGSAMEKVAQQKGFRHIFHGVPSIGGRYSVLSKFGLVPAAAIGVDIRGLLTAARQMVRSCGPDVPPAENVGVQLGVAIGVLAKHGRDKVTLIASPGIGDVGAWLEQLLAESTGKQGKGVIPVATEPVVSADSYSKDRLFAYLRLQDGADPEQDRFVAALEAAGQPVVHIGVRSALHIGQEFFRWEIATAVAGAVIGINAFNQPDVEASKIKTKALTAEFEKTGKLPTEAPVFEDEYLQIYADAKNAAALGTPSSIAGWLAAHFARVTAGDYIGLIAYIERNEAHTEAMQTIRAHLLRSKGVATCLGFGPRFLHSTGQAYKGGPNSGVFLQITCHDQEDLAIPGQAFGFGMVKSAQARGDMGVLVERGRRVLRIHIKAAVHDGLRSLSEAVKTIKN